MFKNLSKFKNIQCSKSFVSSFRSFSITTNRSLVKKITTSNSRIPANSCKLSLCQRAYSRSTEGEDLEGKIDNISNQEYNNISDEYLDKLAESLENLNEEYEQVDAELSHGVLTLQLPPHGTYVINKQPPNKQIWLSSPISGPKRYDLIESKWITLRDGSSLTDLLENEISTALDIEFKFKDLNN
ncbi:YFH1 [Candida jiufengensis]|uniref:YFH1 n=1 Tax=Candida jiufengensis TaxID=497108 RepID=UPI0022257712|nr:YFH1 [Candida jiufengensis]KAI5955039.1 YFH1 [Candida jiufengensis]